MQQLYNIIITYDVQKLSKDINVHGDMTIKIILRNAEFEPEGF